MDRQAWDTLLAQLRALEAKYAAQAAQPAAPPPLAPPTLRQERAALWRIAMLCKDALASPALPPAWRPSFLQVARVCREGATPEDSNRGDHGT
jgi:hypothetical protein